MASVISRIIGVITRQGFPCLFHLLTGLYCPGCGGTRAFRALLAGNLLLSIRYHPLVAYMAVVLTKSTQAIWINCQVPQTVSPGVYRGTVEVKDGDNRLSTLKMDIKVSSRVLPAPSQWAFHLDLWQSPFAVARYYQVPLWSQAHIDAMRPVMKMLADAGQKIITASIMHKPWNGQIKSGS